jgi:hypothetical protein
MRLANQSYTTKSQGVKPNSSGHSTSYSVKQGGENKCWRCGGLHKKKNYPNPLQAITFNFNLGQLFSTTMHMGMTPIIVLHLTQNYGRANHKTLMLVKAKVLGWAKRGKV